MTFYQWITTQMNRGDAVGDIAKDIVEDTCYPKKAPVLLQLDHLQNEHDSSDEAVSAFKKAWREWEEFV